MFDFFLWCKHAESKKTKNVCIHFGKFNRQVLLYQKYIHQDRDQHDVSW